MKLLDDFIEVVSPKWALRRQQSRNALGYSRKFEAGSNSKRTSKWRTSKSDGSSEAGTAAPLLRARARDAVRNNAYARKAATVIRTNVVGRGIRLSLDSANKRAKARMEASWKLWAGTTQCDILAHKNFYGIQRQVIHSVYVDGEVLVVRDRESNRNDEMPFKLQVLEADFLVTGTVQAQMPAGNYISNGIEFDRKGRRIAYYLYRKHPGASDSSYTAEYYRAPASDVLHIYKEDRPGQNRGASHMASALLRLKDVDKYEDAQIVRQIIASCFAIFVHGDAGSRQATNADGGLQTERVEPGMIERLAPGENVTFGSPPETKEYDPYMKRMLQGIAAGFGITYESLTNDYSNVNFSSARMAWIEMSRAIEELQDEIIILLLCDNVWNWFVEGAAIEGTISDRVTFDVHWTPPGRAMLDPVKEMKGILEQLRARTMSWQDAVRRTGQDPDQLFAEILEDRKRFDDESVLTSADPNHDNPAPAEPEVEGEPKKVKEEN